MNIIAIHTQHDANLTIQIDGEIVLVIELERLFNQRYFTSSDDPIEFHLQWTKALEVVYNQFGKLKFDYAIVNWVVPSKVKLLQSIIDCINWIKCDHHHAHAALGYYTSNLRNPLILSADGGGNDGIFNFYEIINDNIELIERNTLNLGTPYRLLATLMPEITNNRPQPRMGHLSLSGKVMGYSALGEVIDSWIEPLNEYYRYYQYPIQALYSLGIKIGLDLEEGYQLEDKDARNLAATSQKVFENILLDEVSKKVNKNYDGIILTGGIALNVLANTKLMNRLNMNVHVPSAPNDCGISAGSILAKFPPKEIKDIAYKGLPLIEDLDELTKSLGIPYALADIATILVEQNAIIGVIRNGSEVGPRALGNRSIICYPNCKTKKDIINFNIKDREWFRPFAPLIKEDSSELFFGQKITSPFMSFALPIKDDIQGKFPAIEHVDKTARIQTVNAKQNAWLNELLDEIKHKTNYPILLNTSFNTKGRPLIAKSSEALRILKETNLTHLIINDLIYSIT